MKLLDLYAHLPLSLKRAAVAAKGAKEHWVRFGPVYRDTLALLRQAEQWTEVEVERYQRSTLRRLLDEAHKHTEYYAETLSEKSIQDAVRALDLSALPIVEKATFKAQRDQFLNTTRRTAVKSRTSGSTGSPLLVEYDRESMQQRFAYMHRLREWAGARAFGPSVRLSGNPVVNVTRERPPYWMENPADRQLLVSTYHMHDDKMEAIFDKLEQFEPEIIDGYPSSILVLARYAARMGHKLPSLRVAITTAETLEPSVREEIHEGLGTQVLDYYAASEGVPFILECVQGRYHMRPESGIFEVLDSSNQPVAPGETGELVATSFAQWRMPQVRYRTGDFITTSAVQELCPCGCVHPTVERIIGRQEDMVVTTDGRWIGMVNYRTLKTLEGVVESQLEQTAPDAFVARLVLTSRDMEEGVRRELEKKIWGLLGYEAKISVEVVDRIPRSSNGKLRAVVRTFVPSASSSIREIDT